MVVAGVFLPFTVERSTCLLGIVLGGALGFVLPASGPDFGLGFARVSSVVVAIARLGVVPMVFFGTIVATDELKRTGRVRVTVGTTCAIIVALAVFAAIVGASAVQLFAPGRIPPFSTDTPRQPGVALSGLPADAAALGMFGLLTHPTAAFALAVSLGIVVGLFLDFDREVTSPVEVVADSSYRLLHRIAAFVVRFAAFVVVLPTAQVVVTLRSSGELALYRQFLLVSIVAVAFVGFGVYPFVLRFLRSTRAVSTWIVDSIGPAMIALATGDRIFAFQAIVADRPRTTTQPRRFSTVAASVVAVFARPGAILLAVGGFLMIVRSFTALEVGFVLMVRLVITAIGASLIAFIAPGNAVSTLLLILAGGYGRGMEDSYRILLPILVLLGRLAVLLDTLTVTFVTTLITEGRSYGGVRVHTTRNP